MRALCVAALWTQVFALSCISPPSQAQENWSSPHISVIKVSSWSEFLDVLNQPHIDVTVRNDGNAAIGTLGFQCRLHLLDRAVPVFDGDFSTTLDRVIRPGAEQELKLQPNMFSELGEIIEHGYRNASWSCYVSHVLTAAGQSISFQPGAIPHKGAPLGIQYAAVPSAMVTPLKLPANNGMWVLKVQPGSIAESAGLRVGDVIVSIDGEPLHVVRDLTTNLDDATTAGRIADLFVIRTGMPIHISVRLGTGPQ